MGLGELIAVAGTMASIFGIFLTIYGVINNRTLKETARHTEELISAMGRENREILLRIEEGQAEIRKAQEETRKAQEEARIAQEEARKGMAEAIKYLADLIRLEGEQTRQVIRTPS